MGLRFVAAYGIASVEPQGRRGGAVAGPGRGEGPVGRANGLKPHGVAEEGIWLLLVEAVERLDDRRGGAPVLIHAKAIAFRKGLPRSKVGKEIGASETIDGLLGVADEHERTRPPDGIKGLEDVQLHWIRVLELVDKGQGIAGSQAFCEGLAAGATEARRQLAQRILRASKLPLVLLRSQGKLESLKKRVGQPGFEGLRGVQKRLRRGGQRPPTDSAFALFNRSLGEGFRNEGLQEHSVVLFFAVPQERL